jgi:hypothetical protein
MPILLYWVKNYQKRYMYSVEDYDVFFTFSQAVQYLHEAYNMNYNDTCDPNSQIVIYKIDTVDSSLVKHAADLSLRYNTLMCVIDHASSNNIHERLPYSPMDF